MWWGLVYGSGAGPRLGASGSFPCFDPWLSLGCTCRLTADAIILPILRGAVLDEVLLVNVERAQLFGHIAHEQPPLRGQVRGDQRVGWALKNRRKARIAPLSHRLLHSRRSLARNPIEAGDGPRVTDGLAVDGREETFFGELADAIVMVVGEVEILPRRRGWVKASVGNQDTRSGNSPYTRGGAPRSRGESSYGSGR